MVRVDYFKNSEEFVAYSAGDVIFNEAEQGEQMYAVKEGEVEILVHGKAVEMVEAGQFFGEMALIDRMPRSAKAVAKTDCKVVLVDKQHFLFLVQETPTFALQVMHTLADRLRHMNEVL